MAAGQKEEAFVWPPSDALPPAELSGDMKTSDFEGMNLDEAYALFCEAPESYADDFMWMEEEGFRYYYPVIDRYLRSFEPLVEQQRFRFTDFIASSIWSRFYRHENMSGLHEPILALCDYVCAHLSHFHFDESDQKEIHATWTDLRQKVADDARGIRCPRQ